MEDSFAWQVQSWPNTSYLLKYQGRLNPQYPCARRKENFIYPLHLIDCLLLFSFYYPHFIGYLIILYHHSYLENHIWSSSEFLSERLQRENSNFCTPILSFRAILLSIDQKRMFCSRWMFSSMTHTQVFVLMLYFVQ